MQPISNISSNMIQRYEAFKVKENSKAQQTENERKDNSLKPVSDEYIPEEKQKPTGLYRLGKDKSGNPKIYFDDPTAPERNVEICEGNTDKVDREIEKLKQMQKKLEQQVNTETDKTKKKTLEQKLAQVQNELLQKDNDTYRRQHSVFS